MRTTPKTFPLPDSVMVPDSPTTYPSSTVMPESIDADGSIAIPNEVKQKVRQDVTIRMYAIQTGFIVVHGDTGYQYHFAFTEWEKMQDHIYKFYADRVPGFPAA